MSNKKKPTQREIYEEAKRQLKSMSEAPITCWNCHSEIGNEDEVCPRCLAPQVPF